MLILITMVVLSLTSGDLYGLSICDSFSWFRYFNMFTNPRPGAPPTKPRPLSFHSIS